MTWLGSTMGCCECHDHKFDPFTPRDFYWLAAFFADVKQWGVYMDYGYTPNPDLEGFTNDHPFPPEIEVESNPTCAGGSTMHGADRQRGPQSIGQSDDGAQATRCARELDRSDPGVSDAKPDRLGDLPCAVIVDGLARP